jgi:hypothetical protein
VELIGNLRGLKYQLLILSCEKPFSIEDLGGLHICRHEEGFAAQFHVHGDDHASPPGEGEGIN